MVLGLTETSNFYTESRHFNYQLYKKKLRKNMLSDIVLAKGVTNKSTKACKILLSGMYSSCMVYAWSWQWSLV